jgi:hypothetical protein
MASAASRGQHGAGTASAPLVSPGSAKAANGGDSALGSLAAALTGSASSGGLGALLPVILVVALLGTAAMAILRRRGHPQR